MSEHERYERMSADYALGALEAEERARFEAHLETCAACRAADNQHALNREPGHRRKQCFLQKKPGCASVEQSMSTAKRSGRRLKPPQSFRLKPAKAGTPAEEPGWRGRVLLPEYRL